MVNSHSLPSKFSGERKCIEHIFHMKYPSIVCRKCGRKNSFSENPNKRCFTCSCGQEHIYPKEGTLFEHSKIPLMKWFYALQILCHDPNISTAELGREVHVTYVTAMRMKKKIQEICTKSTSSTKKDFEKMLHKAVFINK